MRCFSRSFTLFYSSRRRYLSTFVEQDIREWAAKPLTDVSMQTLYDFGWRSSTPPHPSTGPRDVLIAEQTLSSALFLRQELPKRLAQRVLDLTALPYGLSGMPSVQNLVQLYSESFRRIVQTPPPQTSEQEIEFTGILDGIIRKHRDVAITMAQGIRELQTNLGHHQTPLIEECPFLQDFLDRFFLSRIAIRVMIAHHLALHEEQQGWVGIINTQCRPYRVLRDAIDDATEICERTYGVCPDVKLVCNSDLMFQYIPEHIHYVVFELLKNSLRSTVEFHSKGEQQESETLPRIDVIVADGEEDITIKISDRGGGIARKDMHRVWMYAYSTAQHPDYIKEEADQSRSNPLGPLTQTPMAGLGYGLPMSRLHARAFGGDLVLIAMDRYGVDAYLYLKKLEANSADFTAASST